MEDKESGVLDPERGVWAPALWIFLHALVEKTGSGAVSPVIDEVRELHWLLNHLDTVIPCTVCRKHCIEYRKEHPLHRGGGFSTFKNTITGFSQEDVRRWLWNFHESVNVRLEKQTRVELAALEEIYKGIDIRKAWKFVWEEIYPELGRKGGLDADKMREYNRHVILWRGFTGN